MLPVHGHIGMTGVFTDYVPKIAGKAALGPARMALLGLTGVSIVGLLNLNLRGEGMTASVKSLWRAPKT